MYSMTQPFMKNIFVLAIQKNIHLCMVELWLLIFLCVFSLLATKMYVISIIPQTNNDIITKTAVVLLIQDP